MASLSSNVPVDTLLDLTDSSSSVKTVLPWDDSGLREEAIRLHYTNRINEQIETVFYFSLFNLWTFINFRVVVMALSSSIIEPDN